MNKDLLDIILCDIWGTFRVFLLFFAAFMAVGLGLVLVLHVHIFLNGGIGL